MKALTFLAALLAVFFTGCKPINSLIVDPKVSFKSVEIVNIGLSGVNLVAFVDVENPNSFSIPMPKVDWELFINKTPFINGTVEDSQTIKSRGKATLSVPISVSYDRLFNTFASLLGAKEVPYDLALSLRFPIPLLEHKVFKQSYSGRLPLQPW
jgi:LEA14-like dessication related protein